jgi:hypothetical protein
MLISGGQAASVSIAPPLSRAGAAPRHPARVAVKDGRTFEAKVLGDATSDMGRDAVSRAPIALQADSADEKLLHGL